jgi:hypothetical protein
MSGMSWLLTSGVQEGGGHLLPRVQEALLVPLEVLPGTVPY